MVSTLSCFRNYCDVHLNQEQLNACLVVLDTPEFAIAPGGAKHHHNYRGGLIEHTLEVAEMAMRFTTTLNLEKLALIAAIFHDYGKIHEYKFNEDGTINSNPELYHLPYSWEFFRKVAGEAGMEPKEIDEISHAILAHHGRKEWGSPVEPRTPLAFALHSADMLSMQGWNK